VADLVADTELDDLGDGRFARMLSRDWEIWGPNGGYMASLALRATARAAGRTRPANISVHFLAVAGFDEPVIITTSTLRRSKVATSVQVNMRQGDRDVLQAMVWAVDADLPGLAHDHQPMPDVAQPLELPTMLERFVAEGVDPPPPMHRFWDNFDQRPTRWIPDWPNRSGLEPENRNWMRFVSGSFSDPWLDACRMVLLVDLGGWPAADVAHPQSGFMAPTIDVSCEFHRFDAGAEWLLLEGVSPFAGGGLVASRQHVWDGTGRLMASGISHLLCRQLPQG
jgi:acyl-CoA thioesterase II